MVRVRKKVFLGCMNYERPIDKAKVDANKKIKLQKETQQALKYFEKAPSGMN